MDVKYTFPFTMCVGLLVKLCSFSKSDAELLLRDQGSRLGLEA